MKACIVSMEYKKKNNIKIEELDELKYSYSDAKKAEELFKITLGWD